MPDSGLDPIAEFDGLLMGDGGSPGGGINPSQPVGGGGTAVGMGAVADSGMTRRPGARRRPMQGAQNQGVMGPMPGNVDPQMIAMVARFFAQHFSGQPGQARPAMSPQQGPPMSGMGAMMGGMPMQAFARGGIVTQPTIGLLGENGPEAVVPLGGQQFGAYQTQGSPWGGYGQMQGGVQGPYGGLLNSAMQGLSQRLAPNNADPRIVEGLRQRAIQDAHAQSRSARLGLMGRSDIDPSTYGFQALMSDLMGQGQVANSVNQAWLQQMLAAQDFQRQSEMQRRGIEEQKKGFDWGGALGGIGKLGAGLFGGPAGAAVGGGGASPFGPLGPPQPWMMRP